MEKLVTENLFLLEFLVDEIRLDSRCDCDTPPGEHCVSFQFLDNDPLEVCEADFTSPDGKYGKQDSMKNGKSCLFSMTPEQVQKASDVFDVVITVFKKMQPGWLPDKICIGSALVSISNLFVELIQSVELSTDSSPMAKTLKDYFTLVDSSGSTVGKVSVYIRMSCFGKLIVTQFQMNLEDQSVLFKDKGGQSLYRYKKAKRDQDAFDSCPGPEKCLQPSTQQLEQQMQQQQQMQMQQQMQQMQQMQQQMPPPNPNCPMTPCFPQGMPGMFPQFPEGDMFAPPASPQSSMFPMLPCNECSMMMEGGGGGGGGFGGGFGSGPMGQQPPCFSQEGNMQLLTPCEECGTLLPPQFKADVAPSGSAPYAQMAQPQDPPGNYQEIGASMGGNALTIRVHKDKNKIEQVEGSGSVLGSEGSCTCSPGNLGAKKPKKEPPCPPQAPPQNLDFAPGIQQGDKNLPFSFRMSGAGCTPNNNVVINPPVSTKPDGTKFAEISDPNKEMFILRIGKKSEGVEKKANLELELCTPRGPDLKPIPKKETRDCQYDPADCKAEPAGKGKGGKGGGKGGKGGKGKKGKK